MDVDSSLRFKIDLTTGDQIKLADYSQMTYLFADMTYDVTTEFLKVNTSTGEVTSVGPLGNTSQITSLCIPYTPVRAKCPDMVTDISIESAQAGALKATISFKAPVKTLSGATLDSISKIEVFRNGISVKTIDNPVPGKTQSFEDAVTEKGIYHYKIVVSNAEGNGIPVFVDSFIGEDVPGAPSEIILSRDGDSPPMKLEAGIAYRIRFDVRESFTDKTERLQVYLGEGNPIKDMTKELGSYEIKNIDFETKTITLVTEHTGTYHLGLYACSQADQWWICIQNLIVEQLFEKDLSSINISGQVVMWANSIPEINLYGITSGIYVVKVYRSNQAVQVCKIVK